MPNEIIDKLEACFRGVKDNAERCRRYNGTLAKECEKGLALIAKHKQESADARVVEKAV